MTLEPLETIEPIKHRVENPSDINNPVVSNIDNPPKSFTFEPRSDIKSSEIAEIIGGKITVDLYNKLSPDAQRHFIA